MTKRNPEAENPKHKQGDGAGFGRLRAAQALRERISDKLRKNSTGFAEIYIDQIREYAGAHIVFYRAINIGQFAYEQARVAVAIDNGREIRITHDIIAVQA
jgi:hypothetical protein